MRKSSEKEKGEINEAKGEKKRRVLSYVRQFMLLEYILFNLKSRNILVQQIYCCYFPMLQDFRKAVGVAFKII
ncbi:hypothetical protein NC652_011719 [Populus alba x Populus x berolinensis]|nr:hypothetical protein NC652_011719 [Populus alba x Populus x berolinensis]